MHFLTLQRWLLLAAVLWLAGCAGTIQRESSRGAQRLENARYTAVDVVLTDEGRREAADNPLFNVRELGDYVRRRLEGRNLLDTQGTHRVEVSIQHVRVRSGLSAVMLGVMAGADLIEGYVRVYDQRGRQVHGYKVNASYGLGGLAGGQDTTRLGWLYDKFSDLAVAELAGATEQNTVAKGRARPDPQPSAAPPVTITPSAAPSAPAVAIAPPGATPSPRPVAAPAAPAGTAPQPRPIATGFAAIDDIDAIPFLSDRGRNDYAQWLKLPTPRAFAIANNGYYWHTSGVKPKDETLPPDPVERALLMCEKAAKRPCKLYAVNRAVVWSKD